MSHILTLVIKTDEPARIVEEMYNIHPVGLIAFKSEPEKGNDQ